MANAAQPVPNTTGTNPPKLKAPAGATDCHIHIYDPRFQPAVKRPANATVADYRLLQKRLDEGGIRGVRFTTGDSHTAVTTVDMIEPLAKRIAPFGWHVQLNMPVEQIVGHADTLRRLPVQMVFDHMGKVP